MSSSMSSWDTTGIVTKLNGAGLLVYLFEMKKPAYLVMDPPEAMKLLLGATIECEVVPAEKFDGIEFEVCRVIKIVKGNYETKSNGEEIVMAVSVDMREKVNHCEMWYKYGGPAIFHSRDVKYIILDRSVENPDGKVVTHTDLSLSVVGRRESKSLIAWCCYARCKAPRYLVDRTYDDLDWTIVYAWKMVKLAGLIEPFNNLKTAENGKFANFRNIELDANAQQFDFITSRSKTSFTRPKLALFPEPSFSRVYNYESISRNRSDSRTDPSLHLASKYSAPRSFEHEHGYQEKMTLPQPARSAPRDRNFGPVASDRHDSYTRQRAIPAPEHFSPRAYTNKHDSPDRATFDTRRSTLSRSQHFSPRDRNFGPVASDRHDSYTRQRAIPAPEHFSPRAYTNKHDAPDRATFDTRRSTLSRSEHFSPRDRNYRPVSPDRAAYDTRWITSPRREHSFSRDRTGFSRNDQYEVERKDHLLEESIKAMTKMCNFLGSVMKDEGVKMAIDNNFGRNDFRRIENRLDDMKHLVKEVRHHLNQN